MHRLWVRWALLIVFVGLIGTVFVNLGDWQLDRLRQRRERNAATIGIEQAPVRTAEDIITRTITSADQWRQVEVRGSFNADHLFLVRYRDNGGSDGYEVVMTMRMATGTLLVDRAF